MNWKAVPNQLTVGRLIISGAFFVLVGLYCQDAARLAGAHQALWNRVLLNAAFVVYIVAGLTDVADGYLARKMDAVSAFGRIVDPFVDKVLAVGAFAMLTGASYAYLPSRLEQDMPRWITGGMASGVQAWMVVVIFAREMIVSAVRGFSESCGVKFPATSAGKLKMFVQSVAICTVLYQLANLPHTPWAIYTKLISVWAAVVVTVASGLAYVGRTRRLLRQQS